jgi:Outer membrane protein beta-barrel domain
MKRLIIAVMVAIMGLSAMAPSAHAIGLMASWWQIDKTNDDGFGFGMQQKFNITPLFSFDTRASWIKFNDSKTSVFPIEATGMVNIALLYAGVGVGYYVFNVDNAQNYGLDNNFGWYVLGGAHIGLGPCGVFGEIKWTSLSADVNGVDPKIQDVPTSIKADGIGFNVGVSFGK